MMVMTVTIKMVGLGVMTVEKECTRLIGELTTRTRVRTREHQIRVVSSVSLGKFYAV